MKKPFNADPLNLTDRVKELEEKLRAVEAERDKHKARREKNLDNAIKYKNKLKSVESERDDLKEKHLLQLAGISTASLCNTEKSISENLIKKDNPYWTVAYSDVVICVKREMVLREKLQSLEKIAREADQCHCGNCRTCIMIKKIDELMDNNK